MIKQTLDYYNAKYGWDEEGASAVEYGILVALIAAVIILVITTLGTTLNAEFQKIVDGLTP